MHRRHIPWAIRSHPANTRRRRARAGRIARRGLVKARSDASSEAEALRLEAERGTKSMRPLRHGAAVRSRPPQQRRQKFAAEMKRPSSGPSSQRGDRETFPKTSPQGLPGVLRCHDGKHLTEGEASAAMHALPRDARSSPDGVRTVAATVATHDAPVGREPQLHALPSHEIARVDDVPRKISGRPRRKLPRPACTAASGR